MQYRRLVCPMREAAPTDFRCAGGDDAACGPETRAGGSRQRGTGLCRRVASL